MSSKSTLFLTKDNEHCYEECNSPQFKDTPFEASNFIGYTIVIEISKKNVRIISNDDEDIILEIDPGSELYSLIKKMRDF